MGVDEKNGNNPGGEGGCVSVYKSKVTMSKGKFAQCEAVNSGSYYGYGRSLVSPDLAELEPELELTPERKSKLNANTN